MGIKRIRWGLVLTGFLVAEITMIAAAILWVAIYSYLIHPGERVGFYENYAQTASPFVALLPGVPVFFAISRWMRSRYSTAALPTALAMFGVLLATELCFHIFVGNPAITNWFQLLNLSSKFAACVMGARLRSV